MRNRYQDRIRPPSLSSSLDLLYQLTTCRVKRLGGPQGQTLGPPFGDRVARIYAGAGQFADHQELQADRPATHDQNGFARGYAGFLDGFEDGVDGFEEGGFLEADVVGQRDDPALGNPGHGFDILGKAATVRTEARRKAGGLVLPALREKPAFAIKAVLAWDVMKTHHPIAGLELGDARTGGDDRAGKLMTQDLRRLDVALEDFLDVRAADPAGCDFDQHFVAGDVRNGNFFDADDTLVTIDAGAHGPGDGCQGSKGFGHRRRRAHRAATSRSSGGGPPCVAKESFLMKASKKWAKASAAVLLSRPSLISAGN